MKGTEKGALSPMTVFAWVAISIGIAAMSILLSVMYGFEGALRDRVLTAFPHVLVKTPDGANGPDNPELSEKLRTLKHAEKVEVYLEAEMILRSDYRTLGGVVRGLTFEDLQKLKAQVVSGDLPKLDGDLPQVLVGSELATRLGISPKDRLKILSPLKKSGLMGMAPESETFEVSGLYTSGHYEFDQQYLMTTLEDAQDLLKAPGKISGWHVWAPHLDQAQKLEEEIRTVLSPPWEPTSWRKFNSALFDSLRLEQFSMGLILNFAILISVLNIIITLMMHVTHKRKNIGILRALGASQKQIRNIFILQGIYLGMVGLVVGAILTVVGLLYLKYFSTFQLPEIYYDRSIPVEVRPLSLVTIYLGAVVMIFLSTLFPASRASKLDPIEAIRE